MSWTSLRPFPSEIRLALRWMRKQPLTTAVATLSFAVGIALATTAFVAWEAALWSTLPFEHGDRFVRLRLVTGEGTAAMDAERFEHLEAASRDVLVEHLGAFEAGRFNLGLRGDLAGDGKARPELLEPVIGTRISPSTFEHLPYRPLLGRRLRPADAEPGAPRVAVVREDLWRIQFGADRAVLGRVVTIDGVAHEIVGVLPEDAGFPANGVLWSALPRTDVGDAEVFAILREGVDPEVAAQGLSVMSRAVDSSRGTDLADGGAARLSRVALTPYTEPPPGAKPMLTVFVAILVLLLAVVASNIANLILVRTASRADELAIRRALGAPRSRIVSQVFLEVLVLAGLAGVVGALAAAKILAYFDAAITERPFWIDFAPGPETIAFVTFLTLLCAALGSVPPALRATRDDLGDLRGSAPGSGQGAAGIGRFGAVMTVVQLGLSLALLTGALVMAHGLAASDQAQLRFSARQVLTARVDLPPAARDEGVDLERIRGAVAALPEVTEVGATSNLPGMDPRLQQVRLDDESDDRSGTEAQQVPIVSAGPGFLESLGATPVAGRLLDARDFIAEGEETADRPLRVVVNEPFVERHLRGTAAIGRRLTWTQVRGGPLDLEIVGVVPDLGISSLDADTAAGLYAPLAPSRRSAYLSMRVGDPRSFEPLLRRALGDLDPRIQISQVQTLDQVGAEERAFFAGFGSALVATGLLAMLLSLAGLYATTSLVTARREREIGLRVALGAGRRQILSLVLGSGLRRVAAGTALGALLALAVLRLKDHLFVTRLPDLDPRLFLLVVLTLGVAVLAASWLPARRALGVEPADALRAD